MNWMIYGANGYTGRLVAEEAARRGLKPILAGRGEAVEELARQLGLEARRFDLSDAAAVAAGLKGVRAVLHCAGPFSATSRPMLDGCLASGVHYLDVTGEIPVFEAVHARTEEIARAGIVAIPGVGFDVVPSDCLAAMLKDRLPSATRLTLAFQSQGPSSPGTTKTMLEGLAAGGAVRKEGRIVPVLAGETTREIDYGKGPRLSLQIPWGDVSTAYYSTGIPNIEVYTVLPTSQIKAAKVLGPLMRLDFLQRAFKWLVGVFVKGPTAQQRETLKCRLWGEVSDESGATREMRLEIPEGYRFTVDSSLACMGKVLASDLRVRTGALTPSMAFGKDFVLALEGVKTTDRTQS
jgi:short subunit dehydrogenase-like uncharacterized protein